MNEIRSYNQGMIYFADIDTYMEKHMLLLNALRHVETGLIMPAPTGDDGLSIGPLQIRFLFPFNCFSVVDSPVFLLYAI